MKIKCLTKFKDVIEGVPVTFELEDQCSVPDEDGARFCAAGWAQDMDGKVATGEPTGGATTLQIHNSTLGVTSTTL